MKKKIQERKIGGKSDNIEKLKCASDGRFSEYRKKKNEYTHWLNP